MKKVVLVIMLAVFTLGSYAQTKQGDMSIGANVGYGFDSENVTLGVDFRYNITDPIRIAPSITHFVKKDFLSAWAIDLNAHYVFPLTDMFSFYPLAGLSLTFWKADLGLLSYDDNRFGANIGLGGELYATQAITIGLEVKYNIVKDFDQALFAVRVGYNF